MIIYAIILVCLGIFSIAYQAGAGEDKKSIISTIDFLIMLPIFGRIFGWW